MLLTVKDASPVYSLMYPPKVIKTKKRGTWALDPHTPLFHANIATDRVYPGNPYERPPLFRKLFLVFHMESFYLTFEHLTCRAFRKFIGDYVLLGHLEG
jgi:hypothetical protein